MPVALQGCALALDGAFEQCMETAPDKPRDDALVI
jgi:hypothetical protein